MNAPTGRLVLPGRAAGTLAAPGSKSVTNRLLAIACLADGEARLRGPLDSDDGRAMAAAVRALGATVTVEGAEDPAGGGTWLVQGRAGRLRAPQAPVDAHLSGTTMRFVTAMAPLADGPVRVTGAAPLLRRPIGPLVDALRTLGADVVCADGLPPVDARAGGLTGGRVVVDVTSSSQFASALLLVAPFARRDVDLTAHGPAAGGYIDLTVAALRATGAVIETIAPARWRVTAGTGLRPPDVRVAADASAACHLYALAAATGGSVTVTNAGSAAGQPDAGFPEVLAAMGCAVRTDRDAVTVRGPDALTPVDVDLSAMPDQVTSLAALAALAEGRSTISGVGVARTHETDRLAALSRELRRLGVPVEETPSTLIVQGGKVHGPATLQTYDDHRLAMAFTALGAACEGITVADPGCVAKTYPRFWDDAAALGVDTEVRT